MVHIAGSGRGTYRIDRKFPGIGRICKSSGTKDVATFKQMDNMLTHFYHTGKLDILEEIRNGTVTIMMVYAKWIKGELDKLPSAVTLTPLLDSMLTWNSKRNVTPQTIYNSGSNITRFIREAGSGTIHDAPIIVAHYRQFCIDNDMASSYNTMRRLVLNYISDTLKSTHPLYRDVRVLKTLKQRDKRKPRHYTVVQMVNLLSKLSEPHKSMARTLLFTTMGWTEYTGKWTLEDDWIHIKGKKTKYRDRIIPKFEKNLIMPCRHKRSFVKALKKADLAATIASFRCTFANWMAECGIPTWRKESYMGHGPQTMTQHYERSKVEQYFSDDVEKMTAYINKELQQEKKKTNVPSHAVFQLVRTLY